MIAMIDGDDPSLREAQAMGLLLVFAGEAEGRLDEVLRDAFLCTAIEAALQLHEGPAGHLDGRASFPLLRAGTPAQRIAGATTSFDAGRGCPYQCSFCTICINVQGRKFSRRRTPDDVEKNGSKARCGSRESTDFFHHGR